MNLDLMLYHMFRHAKASYFIISTIKMHGQVNACVIKLTPWSMRVCLQVAVMAEDMIHIYLYANFSGTAISVFCLSSNMFPSFFDKVHTA